MFTIDDVQWDVKSKISRTSEMQESEISGMLMNKEYFADVIGTFLKYDVELVLPFGKEKEYSEIYEKLTEPVGGHTFIVPYNQTTIEITGRVENIQDTCLRRTNSHYWMDISFTIISNFPTKTMSLDEVIARGLPPLPDESEVDVGEAYICSMDGWEPVTDVDDKYY